ncbi:hypothetical protein [Pelagicoccus sp. SDUM812003]|uniref:hypothetical protein n=1 Tax=Pelagicoccus sp. SDUM812003 TaxID=3041267 RepID=UPI00280D4D67|nr:hypothetical protein [Pelagicoccus sp. SDUM812003]MDQ8202485.1 hypothetical protein [Pelagicoccus sp. SDUM812003]
MIAIALVIPMVMIFPVPMPVPVPMFISVSVVIPSIGAVDLDRVSIGYWGACDHCIAAGLNRWSGDAWTLVAVVELRLALVVLVAMVLAVLIEPPVLRESRTAKLA